MLRIIPSSSTHIDVNGNYSFNLAKKSNSLFADGMILYVDNPKESTPKLLKLLQEFSDVAGYKISAQKSAAILYINNVTEESVIKELIPFTTAQKNTKYLGINLPKVLKDLYSKNYRTLMKEIEEDTKKWKSIPCSWIERINIVKMSILRRAIYKFSATPFKIPLTFFKELEQTILKLYGIRKDPK